LRQVDHAWFQCLKLKCDELPSNFAFNFDLRRYGTENEVAAVDVLNKEGSRN
jgi:hypothetical protein